MLYRKIIEVAEKIGDMETQNCSKIFMVRKRSIYSNSKNMLTLKMSRKNMKHIWNAMFLQMTESDYAGFC